MYRGHDLTDPVATARLFYAALLGDPPRADVLEQLVAPETAHRWGDFTSIAQAAREVGAAGVWNAADYATGDRTVAYVALIDQATIDDPPPSGPAIVPCVLSVVWREEFDQWVVFGLGEPQPPEAAPREP